MSERANDHLVKEHERDYPSKSTARKYCWLAVAFLLGAIVALIPTIIIILREDNCPSTPSPEPPAWNVSDYISNSDYYQQFSDTHVFTQQDNLRLDRLSSPRLHPTNGRSVIYLRTQYHMPDLKGSSTTLHWIDLSKTGKPVQLTRPIWGISDQQFYWVNDKTILFLSNRASSGLNQLFQLNLPDDVSTVTNFLEPVQITNYSLNIDNLLVNRQATRLAFSCQVYANLTIQETADHQAAEKALGSLVYKFDKLFIRHWDEYMLGPRNHPFVVSIEQDSKGIFGFTSEPIDVLFGIDSDSPTRPFGDGKTQWSFSATGNKFAYTRQHDETSEVAWTTNLDIYTVNLNASEIVSECLTCGNQAADTDPSYSPTDDQVIVYRAQSVPGYESDQFKVKLHNGSENITLLNDWDRSIQATTWSLDGKSLFFEIGENASNVIYIFSDILSNTSIAECLTSTGTSHDVNFDPTNNETFVFTHESITEPPNIYLYISPVMPLRPVTSHNNILLTKARMSTVVELFSFLGANNETVWGWHVQPVNGTAEKAPLAFLIHGGPQSSWYDAWSYRWNFQIFASQGYAVIAINFHGSDSYTQNFTDSITGNYGTLPFEDLQLGLTAALQNFTYIDGNRAAALGASYGGYMINWIAGHPEMSQRFKTLVCHDGLFDMRGMGYSTEELWFSEHDAGGYTPYENATAFEEFNPVNHVANWTQPMLIIHGGRDYRVPDTQGISAFTALQRRGIPSRMLYLPNENHWTLNPLNSIIWYDEVLNWIQNWTK